MLDKCELHTHCGIVTLVTPLQPENAEEPMFVTLSGSVTLVRPLQPSNAEEPMLVTPCGIDTFPLAPAARMNVMPSFDTKEPFTDA